jgi:hypothetical protein
MTIPDRKVKVEERDENGSTFFYLKHNYIHGAFVGLPADGPYATKEEALEARARFVSIVEKTLGDET